MTSNITRLPDINLNFAHGMTLAFHLLYSPR